MAAFFFVTPSPSEEPDPSPPTSSSSSSSSLDYLLSLEHRCPSSPKPQMKVHGMSQIIAGVEPQYRSIGLVMMSSEYDARGISYPAILLDEKSVSSLIMSLRDCLQDLRRLPLLDSAYGAGPYTIEGEED